MRGLQKITLKCTNTCPYSCVFCSGRNRHYSAISRDEEMDLKAWCSIVDQALGLGVEKIYISGGEPACWPDLEALLKHIRRQSAGVYVNINTNGASFPRTLRLAQKYQVNRITLSALSMDKDLVSFLRGVKVKSTAFDLVGQSGGNISVRFMINKLNYHELPDVLSFLAGHRVTNVGFYYPENDFQEKTLLLDEEQIAEFNRTIKPALVKRMLSCRDIRLLTKIRNALKINRLFNLGGTARADWAQGIFQSNPAPGRCSQPSYYLSVEPDGMVLPCSALVHSRRVQLGNVKKKGLQEMINSRERKDFIAHGTEDCRYCPLPYSLPDIVLYE